MVALLRCEGDGRPTTLIIILSKNHHGWKKYYHCPQSPADLKWSEGAKNLRFNLENRNLEC